MSSKTPKANTDTIELILSNIHWVSLIKSSPDFVWDDILIPYSKGHLPPNERNYKNQFLKEQEEHLSDTSQTIENILKLTDEGSPPHLRVSKIGDIFEIGDKLGHGTFGQVFKAKWRRNNGQNPATVFAIKQIHKQNSHVKSFLNECRNVEKSEISRHHHIVNFHASFTDEDLFGFIMSPVAESTLKDLLEKRSEPNFIIPQGERDSLFEAYGCLLDAIRHLHVELQMRHCDLKPSNILVVHLNDHFLVRLCDLGISYAWDSPQDESTDQNQRGTKKYKAPEVHEPQKGGEDTSHNRLVDIFSLGCIFLEMHAILTSRTLDQMAQDITDDPKKSFRDDWTYAHSLKGVRKWLGDLAQDDDESDKGFIVGVIEDMLCEDRKERKEAQDLLKQVRNHHKYIGECCRPETEESHIPNEPTPRHSFTDPQTPETPEGPETSELPEKPKTPETPERLETPETAETPETPETPMLNGNPRPFKTCKIWSREKGLESRDYKCLENFHRGGEVEIREIPCGEQWATTRWVKVSALQTPSPRTEVERWLPGYYVQSEQTEHQVTFEWSNCDQIHQTQYSRQYAYRFDKVHYRNPDRNNVRMEIDFEKESDAFHFHTLLLKEPVEENPLLKIQTSSYKKFAICKHEWKCSNSDSAENGGKGSLVICAEHLLQHRLEAWFIPNNFDFTLPLQDHRYTKLVSKDLLIPEYRSNVRDRYEEPKDNVKDRGIFDSVELVWLREPQFFDFEADSEDISRPQSSHVKLTLPNFLEALTGWKPLVVFSATEVAQKKERWAIRRTQNKGPADVLCFQKNVEKRIAIRMIEKDESDIKWITATLESSLDTEPSVLDMTLNSRQNGRKLALASVTATEGDTGKPTQQSEHWSFRVEGAARDIDCKLNGYVKAERS